MWLEDELAQAREELHGIEIDGERFKLEFHSLNAALHHALQLEAEAEVIRHDDQMIGLEEDECARYAAMLRDQAEEIRRSVPANLRLTAAARAKIVDPRPRRGLTINPRRRCLLRRPSRRQRSRRALRRSSRLGRAARAPSRPDDPQEPVGSPRGGGRLGGRS